ncbi:XkdQ/YqbQ family protein [Brevibacillus dissolubilis]|uniref:XkdQ/YqbQ family protein n=1 Tax=Brevibacillus dissolubilis TaxID=1844116 RepID=UPI0011160367|nr:hypothetical protein [Brevibacillus dissolubilis]
MINQVWLIPKKGKYIDVTNLVESIDWSGGKSRAPRTLSVKLLDTNRGLHERAPVENGMGIVFRRDGSELFQGVIFTCDYSSGHVSVTAYDELFYLAQNKDSYLFTGKKASDIIRTLCTDFSIDKGEIKDTKHVIPYLLFDGDSLYDMVMKALQITYKHTGQRYALFSREGKVHLIPRAENIRKWVIESGVNLVDYSYARSVEGTVTRVKLITGEEKKTIEVTEKNDGLIEKYGVLQHFEKVSEKLNRAQLQDRAKKILEKEGKEKKTFRLSNIPGIPDVVTGTAVFVVVPELGVKQAYYIEEDSHSFAGRKHTMSLTLTETDDITEVNAGKEEPEKKQDKA